MSNERKRLDNIIRMFEALEKDTSVVGVKHLNHRKFLVINYFLKSEDWKMLEGILQYLEVPEDFTLKEKVAFFRLWAE